MTETQAKKILVIDDEAHIRFVIKVKLKSRGYQVITAKNGQEGLELIYSQKPDAVVTDINMPLLEGDELCRQIDELKKKRPFLTVVITARISPQDRAWVKEMRDTQLMEKPFSPSKLVKCIDDYFERQSS
ncbi:MAG: response regulator, partial [Desulfobacterales bacterium]|nr:response regulator [Candidatus Desulfatibia vada]